MVDIPPIKMVIWRMVYDCFTHIRLFSWVSFSRCISPIIIYPIYGYNNDTIGCLTSDDPKFVGSNMFSLMFKMTGTIMPTHISKNWGKAAVEIGKSTINQLNQL